MGDSSISSKVVKGAFVAYYENQRQPRTIVFQLNPETIRREILPARLMRGSSEHAEIRERISFMLVVDAHLGDDYFVHDGDGESHGVLPFLSAIELLAYPADVFNEGIGSSENSGFPGFAGFFARLFRFRGKSPLPYVGLLLGSQRMIPVKIESIHISERAFDATLWPIRASVKIVLNVLTERESSRHRPTGKMYEHYLRLKVLLANNEARRLPQDLSGTDPRAKQLLPYSQTRRVKKADV